MVDAGRLQPVFIIAAALLGIGAGAVTPLGDAPTWLVEAFLMGLLLVLFLSVDIHHLRDALSNRRFTISAVALNFVLTPVLSFILGIVFFSGSMDVRIGLTMLLVTPCTDWYLVFTRLGGGNVELGMSILPLNLILQVLLLPVYLTAFFGRSADLDVPSLLLDMAAVIIIIPLVAACAVRVLVRKDRLESFMEVRGDNLQLVFLCLAVLVMFASQGEEALDNLDLLVEMFVPLLVFFVLLFYLARLVGDAEGFPRRNTVSLTFTSMARNSPLSLAIAVAAFPDAPMIALALVIGPLIELPVLSVAAWFTRRWVSEAPSDRSPDPEHPALAGEDVGDAVLEADLPGVHDGGDAVEVLDAPLALPCRDPQLLRDLHAGVVAAGCEHRDDDDGLRHRLHGLLQGLLHIGMLELVESDEHAVSQGPHVLGDASDGAAVAAVLGAVADQDHRRAPAGAGVPLHRADDYPAHVGVGAERGCDEHLHPLAAEVELPLALPLG